MYNKVVFVGNLSKDIELRYSQGGMAIANTAIATSRKFTTNGEKKEEVCFVDITFFARSAEVANQYLRKGSKILIEGRLNFEQWVDQNGQKRSKHSVVVETMQMLDSKSGTQDNDSGEYQAQQNQGQQAHSPQNHQASYSSTQQQTQNYQAQTARQSSVSMPRANSIPEIDIDEDEIPF